MQDHDLILVTITAFLTAVPMPDELLNESKEYNCIVQREFQ